MDARLHQCAEFRDRRNLCLGASWHLDPDQALTPDIKILFSRNAAAILRADNDLAMATSGLICAFADIAVMCRNIWAWSLRGWANIHIAASGEWKSYEREAGGENRLHF
jgi:hypothetical protein